VQQAFWRAPPPQWRMPFDRGRQPRSIKVALAAKATPGRIAREPLYVMRERIGRRGYALIAELSILNAGRPESHFLLEFLHNAGARGAGILLVFPGLGKAIAEEFIDYEGNFGLAERTTENMAEPASQKEN
jgi:hypothetical protein